MHNAIGTIKEITLSFFFLVYLAFSALYFEGQYALPLTAFWIEMDSYQNETDRENNPCIHTI